MSLILTLVRHGESTDNLRSHWAGHRDSALTVHGMNQAKRLGKSLSGTHIDAIFASDLKRAHWTAHQIYSQNLSLRTSQYVSQPHSSISDIPARKRKISMSSMSSEGEFDSNDAAVSPKQESPNQHLSPLVTTTLLREQFFGDAEGQDWATGQYTYSSQRDNRGFKFENGEALNDVHARATEVMGRIVLPYVIHAHLAQEQKHLVLVAHGIMISELLFALSKLQDRNAPYTRQAGHSNTGWSRLEISLTRPTTITADPTSERDSEGLFQQIDEPWPICRVRRTHINECQHLTGLKRTKRVGSSQFDEKQKSLKEFFGGASSKN